jgi:hypothetical protein
MMSPDDYMKLAMKSHDFKGTQEEYEDPIVGITKMPFEQSFKEATARFEKRGQKGPTEEEFQKYSDATRDSFGRMDT